MKTIQRKYETVKDKEEEMRLGEKYRVYMASINYEVELENQEFLSTYDFKIYNSGIHKGWLEVKKKTGFFGRQEMIPITKWRFASETPLKCFMLIERDNKAILFNISQIIEKDLGQEREITRRADQPEGSRKVVFFPTSEGKVIYYV